MENVYVFIAYLEYIVKTNSNWKGIYILPSRINKIAP